MNDKIFMEIALQEAEKAYFRNQLPIGAVLTINNEFVGKNSNNQIFAKNWFDHAENTLIKIWGGKIKQARKASKTIELYTTLEPCLMCFGTMVHNRITRIIYACPDPSAGSTHIQPPTEWYKKKWPIIEQGPFRKESYNLFVRFMKENPETWGNVLPLYEKLRPNIL